MFSMIIKDGLQEYFSIRKKQADKDDANLNLNIDTPKFWCRVLLDSSPNHSSNITGQFLFTHKPTPFNSSKCAAARG